MNPKVNQINYGFIKEKKYNNLIQKWLGDNNILMYSAYNKGKSVAAERFIRTLKSKIYKKMTTDNKNSYLDYLNKLVDKYHNTYHHSTDKKALLMLIILIWLKNWKKSLIT